MAYAYDVWHNMESIIWRWVRTDDWQNADERLGKFDYYETD